MTAVHGTVVIAEHFQDVCDVSFGNHQQPFVAHGACARNRGLNEVTEAVQLMAVSEIAPGFPEGFAELVGRVKVTVAALGFTQQVSRIRIELAELGLIGMSELPCHGFQSLEEIGIRKPWALERPRVGTSKPSDISQVARLLQHPNAVKNRHRTVARREISMESGLEPHTV
tara:strand:+ start:1847 stop:2359 length:513 start_codon:yes stop_codon:yes gene_type:complete